MRGIEFVEDPHYTRWAVHLRCGDIVVGEINQISTKKCLFSCFRPAPALALEDMSEIVEFMRDKETI